MNYRRSLVWGAWCFLFCLVLGFLTPVHAVSENLTVATANLSKSFTSTLNNTVSNNRTISTVSGNIIVSSNQAIVPTNNEAAIWDLIMAKTVTRNAVPEPPKKENLYVFKGQENYRYPRKPRNRNVDLEVNGFYELRYGFRDFQPRNPADPRYDIVVNDSLYQLLPNDVLEGDPRFDVRYHIMIDGQLDDDLSVHYDVQQEIDLPGVFDVNVKYKTHQLTFGRYDSTFSQGDFINVKKSLNGAKAESNNEYWRFSTAMGRQRSEPKKFEVRGNGSHVYRLGSGFILRGSLTVWLNNQKRAEYSDYTVNYELGEITFTGDPPQKTDLIKAVYEFTNPIEDFLPILSRKNFFGAQYYRRSQDRVSYLKKTNKSTEQLWPVPLPIQPTDNVTENITVTVNVDIEGETFLVSDNIFTVQNQSLINTDNIQIALMGNWLSTADYQVIDAEKGLFRVSGNYQNRIGEIWYSHESTETVLQQKEVEPTQNVLQKLLTKFMEAQSRELSPVYHFPLAESAVVLGSDKLVLNGFPLERNVDYHVDHSNGAVVLRKKLLETDQLDISYQHYLTQVGREDIVAKDMAGPYELAHSSIIDGSVEVTVNGQALEEIVHYLVDYDKGYLNFNLPQKYPSIISVKYQYIDTDVVSSNSEERPWEVGVSYLSESVQSQEEELNLKVTSRNFTVSGNLILLEDTPLINTENISIVLAGQQLRASSDYRVVSEYRGEIEILLSGSHDGKTGQISFEHRKNLTISESFSGIDGKQIYLIPEDVQILNVPIAYQGIRYMVVNQPGQPQQRIGPESFRVDYGDGFNVAITFFVRDSNFRNSFFRSLPDRNTQLTMFFDYAPPEVQSGELKQTMMGVKVARNFESNWRLETEIIAAQNNFAREIAENEDTGIKGTGQVNQEYQLSQTNLVEDSERVFVQSNGVTTLLNKNIDYVLEYSRGILRFRSLTPGPEDVIDVSYQYFLPGGSTQSGESSGNKFATKFGARYEGETVKWESQYKEIDFDFLPIGNIRDQKGSTIFESNLDWQISSASNLSVDYNRQKIDRRTSSLDPNERFLFTEQWVGDFNTRFFDTFDSENRGLLRFDLEDKRFEENTHPIDQYTFDVTNKVSFGPQFWRFSVLRSLKRTKTDIRDNPIFDGVDPTQTDVEVYQYDSYLTLPDVPILGAFSLHPSYANSNSFTLHGKDITSNAYDIRETYHVDTSVQPHRTLSGKFDYTWVSRRSKVNQTADTNEIGNRNVITSIDYQPFSWLSNRWSLAQRSNESFLTNQRALESEDEKFSQTMSPYGALTQLGFRHSAFYVRPFRGSSFKMDRNRYEEEKNNKRNFNRNHYNKYQLNNFKPFRTLTFQRLSWESRNGFIQNIIDSNTVSQDVTYTTFASEFFQMRYQPRAFALRNFTYTFNWEEQQNDREFTQFSPSLTVNRQVLTEFKPIQKRSQNLTFQPRPLSLPFLFKKRIPLGSVSMYLREDNVNTNIEALTRFLDENGNDVSTQNFLQEFKNDRKYVLGGSISPFNFVTVEGSLTSQNIEQRNNVISTAGLFYTQKRDYQASMSKNIWRFNITLDGAHLRTSQFRSSAQNIQNLRVGDLLDDFKTERYQFLSSYDNTLVKKVNGTVNFQLFKFWDVRTGFGQSLSTQQTFSATANVVRDVPEIFTFNRDVGTTFRFFKDLVIDYKISFETSRQNGLENDGSKDILTATYTPFQRKNFRVYLKYTRQHDWGNIVSQLRRKAIEGSTGQTQLDQVLDTDLVEEVGSIDVDIVLPMNTNPFIDNFTITGEGYLKRFTDHKNDETESFNFAGMLIKGTLNF